jgi:pSer/pThr/pTyr-binding forkhead associated (FHA) protein
MAATHDIGTDLAAEARAIVATAGAHLAWRDDEGELHVHPLTKDWTRIGRSLAADVRFEDPSVLRRHALVVRDPDGVRVLDERRDEQVAWRELHDGDEIDVGRFRLVFVDG